MSYSADLKSFCKSKGADLVGIADLNHFKNKLPVVPENLLEPYHYAVSIAIRLSDKVINEIHDRPTPSYAQLCRDINADLNKLASETVQWIQDNGYRAASVPASLKVDDKNLLGNISHKAVARMAGLGWQGKSLLLINPKFGPRIRLTTVLTDLPLEPDGPGENRCGKCTECFKACPASAIKNTSTKSHYPSREDAIDLDTCHSQLQEFAKDPDIGYTFCGVCISVCPFGKQASGKSQPENKLI